MISLLSVQGSASPSRVLAFLPGDADRAAQEYEMKLALTTDPSDVAADLEAGIQGFIIVDARTKEAYERGHIPGAINFPHHLMDEVATEQLAKDLVYVTYCDGIGCNASTKGAFKLARLGFKVKEMLGGLDWWIRDGYAVEMGAGTGSAGEPGTKFPCGC